MNSRDDEPNTSRLAQANATARRPPNSPSQKLQKQMTESVDQLRSAVRPLREAVLAHPIYDDMRRPQALAIFMEHHVFAVWDFMSLLKALQQRFCCTTVPWIPSTPSPATR